MNLCYPALLARACRKGTCWAVLRAPICKYRIIALGLSNATLHICACVSTKAVHKVSAACADCILGYRLASTLSLQVYSQRWITHLPADGIQHLTDSSNCILCGRSLTCWVVSHSGTRSCLQLRTIKVYTYVPNSPSSEYSRQNSIGYVCIHIGTTT